jgi:hypothetical protein
MTQLDNSSDNDYSDNNLTDDQKKSESIANSENLFDADYYDSLQSDNTYYLTIPYLNENNYLKDLQISTRGFFNHSLNSVQNYIREYTISSWILDTAPLEIVKTSYIQIPGGFTMTNVIIKTFWLKIVQRRWRNVLMKRKQMMYRAMKEREYGIRGQRIPQLRGCLADINNKRIQ